MFSNVSICDYIPILMSNFETDKVNGECITIRPYFSNVKDIQYADKVMSIRQFGHVNAGLKDKRVCSPYFGLSTS
jgi:hypothetical protein